jgi:CBS domain-containing protein
MDRFAGSSVGKPDAGTSTAREATDMAQSIREVMTADPRTVEPAASLADPTRMMRDEDVGAVLVVDGGKASGIVSIGDLAIERDERSALADVSAASPNT